eukprot:GFYU01026394.1.p3 GENE.GFYU01026394.1~~GFYU01026394.1.p3  ORF type:complete len:104 (-),score=33.25 GFYU01026394.1:17-328(-)
MYEVEISNNRKTPCQLLRREWEISDSNGNVESVSGPGVKGETPVLAHGDDHSYFSFVTLKSRWGTMRGKYVFLDLETKKEFDVDVAEFLLQVENDDVQEEEEE